MVDPLHHGDPENSGAPPRRIQTRRVVGAVTASSVAGPAMARLIHGARQALGA